MPSGKFFRAVPTNSQYISTQKFTLRIPLLISNHKSTYFSFVWCNTGRQLSIVDRPKKTTWILTRPATKIAFYQPPAIYMEWWAFNQPIYFTCCVWLINPLTHNKCHVFGFSEKAWKHARHFINSRPSLCIPQCIISYELTSSRERFAYFVVSFET